MVVLDSELIHSGCGDQYLTSMLCWLWRVGGFVFSWQRNSAVQWGHQFPLNSCSPFPCLCEEVVVEGSACCSSISSSWAPFTPVVGRWAWWSSIGDEAGRLEPKAETNVQNCSSPGYLGPADVFSPHRGLFVFDSNQHLEIRKLHVKTLSPDFP